MLFQAATLAAKTLLCVIVFQIIDHLVQNSTLSFMNSVLNALLFASNACVFFIFNKFVFAYFMNILRGNWSNLQCLYLFCWFTGVFAMTGYKSTEKFVAKRLYYSTISTISTSVPTHLFILLWKYLVYRYETNTYLYLLYFNFFPFYYRVTRKYYFPLTPRKCVCIYVNLCSIPKMIYIIYNN